MIIKCTCSDLVNNGDHYCPIHGMFAKSTPPEGEAVPEQVKLKQNLSFLEAAPEEVARMNAAIADKYMRYPVPVVSTAASETPDARKAVEDWFKLPYHDLEFRHQSDLCEGTNIIDVACTFCRIITAMAAYACDKSKPNPVAPESYKPAEGPEPIYPDIWAVAHSGFIQSIPHTQKTARTIIQDKLRENPEDCEWEMVKYIPAATPVTVEASAGLCPKCKSGTFYIECNRCDYDFMGNVFDVFKSFEAQPPCSECATLQEKLEIAQRYGQREYAIEQILRGDLSTAVAECATLRKERDDLLAMFCERHIDTTLSDANVNDDCPLCITESSAEAAEAQLSTLRDALEAIKIALKEPAGGEYWTARKFLDDHGIYNGDLDDLRVLNKVAEAALAPTPEVAPKKCQIKDCVNKVAEMRHCTEHMPGNFPPETVAPKEVVFKSETKKRGHRCN